MGLVIRLFLLTQGRERPVAVDDPPRYR
jgi:hypothetical protein